MSTRGLCTRARSAHGPTGCRGDPLGYILAFGLPAVPPVPVCMHSPTPVPHYTHHILSRSRWHVLQPCGRLNDHW